MPLMNPPATMRTFRHVYARADDGATTLAARTATSTIRWATRIRFSFVKSLGGGRRGRRAAREERHDHHGEVPALGAAAVDGSMGNEDEIALADVDGFRIG